jgi:hypothetical protein
MPRGPSNKLKPFQKVLIVLLSGKPVTIEEFESVLGNDIYTYKISTYIYHIKVFANGIVKSIKNGREVTAYQLVNVDDIKKYFKTIGHDPASFVPSQKPLKPSSAKILAEKTARKNKVNNLVDLGAKAVETSVEDVEVKSEELQVFEITENS